MAMVTNEAIRERLAILAQVAPVSQGAGSVSTAWVSVAEFQRFQAQLQTGVFGGSATVAFKIEQAQNSSGTGAKDLKSATTLAAAGGNNRTVTIDARHEELDRANGFTHIRATITVATAATLVAAQIVAELPRYAPVANGAHVFQQVA